MKIREENCNMVLFAAVTCVTLVVAGGSSLLGAGETGRTGAAEQSFSADKPIIYASDQPAVRTIGAPFVPNTNPRER